MDREKCRAIHAALQKAADEIGKEMGVKMTVPSARFGNTDARFRIEAKDLAAVQAESTEEEKFKTFAKWQGLEPEDFGKPFSIHREQYEVCGLKPGRGKYPVLAKRIRDGKVFKFQAIDVRDALGHKRTEQEILKDLRIVENDLSPENLTCDGELPHAMVVHRRNELLKRKISLIAELGRTPAEPELWLVPGDVAEKTPKP